MSVVFANIIRSKAGSFCIPHAFWRVNIGNAIACLIGGPRRGAPRGVDAERAWNRESGAFTDEHQGHVPPGGVADVIADVVETGTTLRQAGLEPFGDPIMTSQAVLFSRPGLELDETAAHTLEVLERRIRGVLVAREYVLLDYDIPTELLDRAVTITPGFQSPTVSPLHGGEWSAVRSMVERAHAHPSLRRFALRS